MRTRIEIKLRNALSPEKLEVIDESAKHKGHSGYIEGGDTHFRIYIISEQFLNKSRVERHRMIYAILAEEIAERVHALAIQAYTNSEIR